MSMPAILDLSPSLEKIARAESKALNLERLVNEWFRDEAKSRSVFYKNGQTTHVVARIDKLPPIDIAFEFAEGVNHLRSALDKMMVALVERNGRGVSGVGFPFGGLGDNGQPEPFPNGRSIAKLEQKLTADQWDLVLAQKPYPGGNDLLWSVNELANQDKHRKDLITVDFGVAMTQIEVRGGVFGGDGKAGFSLPGDADFICPDQERERLLFSFTTVGGTPEPKINHSVGIGVVIGPIPPVDGMKVVPTFDHQVRMVKGIIEAFSTAFG